MGMSPSADGWFLDSKDSVQEEFILTSLENLIAELEALKKQGFTEQFLQNPACCGEQGPARIPVSLDRLRLFCKHCQSRPGKSL